jgi:hypothetical protein
MYKQSWLIFLFILFACTQCAKQNVISEDHPVRSIKTGFSEEYLNWSENTFRNFFGNEEAKKSTIEQLNIRCHEKNISDAHSCYNLAIIYFYFIKNFDEAYKHSLRATSLSPEDALYRDIYRQSCIKANKIDMLELNYPYQSKTVSEYTKVIESCNNKNIDKSSLENLVKTGVITKQVLSSNFFSECLDPQEKASLLGLAKSNPINYSDYYYKEKDQSHIYSSLWDTIYYTKGKTLVSQEKVSKNLTLYWKEVLQGVSGGNQPDVEKNLRLFLKEISIEKNKNKKQLTLYIALERAAFLLFEQDNFFKSYRSLTKEFEGMN